MGRMVVLRQGQVRLLVLGVFTSLAMVLLVASRLGKEPCHCAKEQAVGGKAPLVKADKEGEGHKLCLIVPFKDRCRQEIFEKTCRYEELMEFAPYISAFLGKQGVEHEVWVVNQADQWRFNRAALINVGFKESSRNCDYVAMHDVDLLPKVEGHL